MTNYETKKLQLTLNYYQNFLRWNKSTRTFEFGKLTPIELLNLSKDTGYSPSTLLEQFDLISAYLNGNNTVDNTNISVFEFLKINKK